MTIVKHPDNPLNFEPLNIYFLSDESVSAAQFEMVLELERFNSFTLGVYGYCISFLSEKKEDVRRFQRSYNWLSRVITLLYDWLTMPMVILPTFLRALNFLKTERISMSI